MKYLKIFEEFNLFNTLKKYTKKSLPKNIDIQDDYLKKNNVNDQIIRDLILDYSEKYNLIEREDSKLSDYISRRKRTDNDIVYFIQHTDVDTLKFLNIYSNKFWITDEIKKDLMINLVNKIKSFGYHCKADTEKHRFNLMAKAEWVQITITK